MTRVCWEVKVLLEKLKSMSFDELRSVYKDFLSTLDVAETTKRTAYTDAFYLWRHNNKELFWSVVLDNDFEEISKKHLIDTLTKNSQGDVVSNVNGYYSHLKKFREFALSETSARIFTTYSEKIVLTKVVKYKKNGNVEVPYPCCDEVEKYLAKWDGLESYHLQENALNKLFNELCPCNKEIEDVLLKCATLNDFYSTNIYFIYPVAKHILELDIDDRLQQCDIHLVDDIQHVVVANKSYNFYSFATKYCSHHKPEDYPIYDSYVEKVLCYYQKNDGFSSFKKSDLKNYVVFKSVLEDFRRYFKLEKYSLKQIDQYIWQLGKEFFPNQY